jgi:hypothetical protein
MKAARSRLVLVVRIAGTLFMSTGDWKNEYAKAAARLSNTMGIPRSKRPKRARVEARLELPADAAPRSDSLCAQDFRLPATTATVTASSAKWWIRRGASERVFDKVLLFERSPVFDVWPGWNYSCPICCCGASLVPARFLTRARSRGEANDGRNEMPDERCSPPQACT